MHPLDLINRNVTKSMIMKVKRWKHIPSPEELERLSSMGDQYCDRCGQKIKGHRLITGNAGEVLCRDCWNKDRTRARKCHICGKQLPEYEKWRGELLEVSGECDFCGKPMCSKHTRTGSDRFCGPGFTVCKTCWDEMADAGVDGPLPRKDWSAKGKAKSKGREDEY